MNMDTKTKKESEAQAIIEAVEHYHKPTWVVVGDTHNPLGKTVMFVPKGMERIDIQAELDARQEAPRRAIGEVKVNTLDAFVALTNRYISDQTVVYVDDGPQPKLVAVLNDHGENADPGWRDHRIVYLPSLSDEWKVWSKFDGQSLSQVDFATLLEDRCLDVSFPSAAGPATQDTISQLGVKAATPAELQGLAKGLSIKLDNHVKEVRRLDSGEAQVIYTEQHNAADGKPLSVPNAFIIAIPVFFGGVGYSLVVRLRYRVREGRITWSYNIVHANKAKRDGIIDMMKTIQLKLPDVLVVEGTP